LRVEIDPETVIVPRSLMDSTKTKDIQDTPEPSSEKPSEETTEAAASAPAESSQDAGSELLEKLGKLTEEANQHRDRYLRAVAEMENIRRRGIKDKEEARRYGALSLIEELLPVTDNFELGLSATEQHEGGKAFAEGFSMVLTQLKQVLEQNGVERIDPTGEAFDPNFHESVSSRHDDEVPEGHVIEVHRVGYRLHDRLIRAATVVISEGPASTE
jgi:molecular chaperone GrpE